MAHSDLQKTIDTAWETRDQLTTATKGPVRDAVEAALAGLDDGSMRVAEKTAAGWQVNQWLKKAVLMSFRLTDMAPMPGGPGGSSWYDKVPSKFEGWGDNRFKQAGFAVGPPAAVRRGAYIAPGVVLMPSFVNLGAYVDANTRVDPWATVGSCAQIGRNVHLAGGVGIGGVLEPVQANPVIIEDNVFVGGRCVIVEGVRIGEGAVLGAGVVLTSSTKIIDAWGKRENVSRGIVPSNAVVVPGTTQKSFPSGEYGVTCALIIGMRKESTDKKTSLTAVLREFDVPV